MSVLFLIASLLVQAAAPLPQARSGVITGQIRGTDGEPADRVRVMAAEESAGGANESILGSVAQTDRFGRYRLEGIPPGRYYVLAGALDAPVYYPGAAMASRARVVNVTAASTTSGVDFSLVSTSFTIGGRVLFENGTTPVSARLTLTGARQFQANLTADGRFEISNVQAGVYTITLTETVSAPAAAQRGQGARGARGGRGGRGAQQQQQPQPQQQRNVTRAAAVFPQTITVGEDDRRLDLRAPLTQQVSGAAAVEGGGQLPRFELVFTGSVTAAVSIDGSFEVQLPAGEYRVSARGLQAGFSLKSVVAGGPSNTRSADPLVITVPNASSSVRVTVAPGAAAPWGKVSGHVSGGGAAEGLSVILTEVSSAATPGGRRAAPIVIGAPVNAAGDFEFSGVLPGRYRAELRKRQDTRLDLTTAAPVSVVVTASKDGVTDVKNVRLDVPAQKEIRGRVQVDGQAPIPNFSVSMSSPNGVESVTRIRPDREGRFTVTVAVGEHMLNDTPALPPGYELASGRYGSTNLEEEPLLVAPNDTAEFRVRLSAPDSKPVQVSGRVADLLPDAFGRGPVRATLTSPVYAGEIETAVRSDGSFTFPQVFPGSYMARITGPGIADDICAPVIAGKTDVRDAVVGRAREIEILSAIYGADSGAADVTPQVTRLGAQAMDEFFAAPSWLLVDPAYGTIKELVVQYQYRCRMFTLTTAEANPVSHAILRTHANGVLAGELWNGPSNATAENVTRQVAAVSAADVEVVSAFYGTGNQFPSVTTKVRDLLQSGAPLFTVTDQTFDVNPDNRHRELLIRYQFRGKRGAVRVGKGENLSMALLANAAESGMDLARYSADPPDWLAEAQPDPPLDAGVSGAGVGQGPRKELGIMALLRTVADLEALRPQDDPTPTQAIPLVRQALAQAQLNIRYTFPPPSMKPMKPRPDSSINGLRNALRNLSEARQHLGAANAGADPESMARALAAIDQAMELIQAKMPGRSTPVGIRR